FNFFTHSPTYIELPYRPHANTLVSTNISSNHCRRFRNIGKKLPRIFSDKTTSATTLYQIPLLRVYRKHDRSLQGQTSWIKQQVTSSAENAFYGLM
ncbi:hypothetical protein L9F63_009802, partial [Diploptera punctata]